MSADLAEPLASYAPVGALGLPSWEPHVLSGEYWECATCGQCSASAQSAAVCCAPPPEPRRRAYMCRACGATWGARAGAVACNKGGAAGCA